MSAASRGRGRAWGGGEAQRSQRPPPQPARPEPMRKRWRVRRDLGAHEPPPQPPARMSAASHGKPLALAVSRVYIFRSTWTSDKRGTGLDADQPSLREQAPRGTVVRRRGPHAPYCPVSCTCPVVLVLSSAVCAVSTAAKRSATSSAAHASASSSLKSVCGHFRPSGLWFKGGRGEAFPTPPHATFHRDQFCGKSHSKGAGRLIARVHQSTRI